MNRILRGLIWLVPVLVLIWFYRFGARSWFQQDDFAWLQLLHDRHPTLKEFLTAMFSPMAQGTIRPWSERLFFYGTQALFGLNSRPFHIIVAGTQFLSLFLLQTVMIRLTRSYLAAFAAAMLWAVGPGLVIPLSWLSAYNQVQCAFFLLLGLVLWLRVMERESPGRWAAVGATFILGFGSLETFIVFPALVTAYHLLYDRRRWIRTIPFWLGSGIYFLLHRTWAPHATSGPYAQHWDLSLFSTFWHYCTYALTAADKGRPLRVPPDSWIQVSIVLAIALVVIAVWKWRSRQPALLFGLAWYVITLSPVLPLRDHFLIYYLGIPSAGLAMTLGALFAGLFRWDRTGPTGESGEALPVPSAPDREGSIGAVHPPRPAFRPAAAAGFWRRTACAAITVVLVSIHTYYVLPFTERGTLWHYQRGLATRAMFDGLMRAHQLHPDALILLSNIDSILFYGIVADHGYRLFGLDQIYLTPGSEEVTKEHPELGDLTHWVLDPAATARAITHHRAVVYQFESTQLRNITRNFGLLMPPEWLQTPCRRVVVGLPEYQNELGSGWYLPEGQSRWMSRTATVRLAIPSRRDVLALRGYCSREGLAQGPLQLTVEGNGQVFGTQNITKATESFDLLYPVPPALQSSNGAVELRLTLNKTFRAQGDLRDLGIGVNIIGWEQK